MSEAVFLRWNPLEGKVRVGRGSVSVIESDLFVVGRKGQRGERCHFFCLFCFLLPHYAPLWLRRVRVPHVGRRHRRPTPAVVCREGRRQKGRR